MGSSGSLTCTESPCVTACGWNRSSRPAATCTPPVRARCGGPEGSRRRRTGRGSPTALGHAGELARVGHLAYPDAGQAEGTQMAAGAPVHGVAVAQAGGACVAGLSAQFPLGGGAVSVTVGALDVTRLRRPDQGFSYGRTALPPAWPAVAPGAGRRETDACGRASRYDCCPWRSHSGKRVAPAFTRARPPPAVDRSPGTLRTPCAGRSRTRRPAQAAVGADEVVAVVGAGAVTEETFAARVADHVGPAGVGQGRWACGAPSGDAGRAADTRRPSGDTLDDCSGAAQVGRGGCRRDEGRRPPLTRTRVSWWATAAGGWKWPTCSPNAGFGSRRRLRLRWFSSRGTPVTG